MKYMLFFLTLFSLNSYAEHLSDQKHLFVVSGVVLNSTNSKKINDLVAMIERKTHYPLETYFVDSYERLSKLLRDNPYALAWTCGYPFVEDSEKDQQQLVAVPLYKGKPLYKSLIVSRKTDPGKSLSDFRGRIFVYSDPRSNSGYLAPSYLLSQQDTNIDQFFRLKIRAGSHEKSIEAIYRGLADIGAIDQYIWDIYIQKRPELLKKLHVIQETGPFPFTPVVAGKKVDPETLKKIRQALTNMEGQDLDKFRADFKMDGFVVKEKTFYQPIKDMISRINNTTKLQSKSH